MSHLSLTSFRAPRSSLRSVVFSVSVLLLMLNAPQIVKAQSCPNEPQGGGEGISASASINGTTQLTDGGFVSAGTNVRLDSIATAGGACVGMAWYCQQTPCTCEATGYVYQRTINHTNVYVDVTSSGGLNGTYFVGTVQFQNAYEHTLSSGAANTSGPNYFTLSSPGSYTFRFQGIINTTPCNIQPGQTAWTSITLNAHPNDAAKDSGDPDCNGIGEPVNVTNGNTYLQQTDYRLPGIGEGLVITRSYNSKNQTAGLFGYGWSSILDESIITYGTMLLRLNLADGARRVFDPIFNQFTLFTGAATEFLRPDCQKRR